MNISEYKKLSDDEIEKILEEEAEDELTQWANDVFPAAKDSERSIAYKKRLGELNEQIKELEIDAISVIVQDTKWTEKSKKLKKIEQEACAIKFSDEYQNLLKKIKLEESKITRRNEDYTDEEWYDSVVSFLDSLPEWPNVRFSHDIKDIVSQEEFQNNQKELESVSKEIDEIRSKRRKALLSPNANEIDIKTPDYDIGRKKRFLHFKYPASTEECNTSNYGTRSEWEEECKQFKENFGIDYTSYRDKDLKEKIKRMEELELATLPVAEKVFENKVKAPVSVTFSEEESETKPAIMLYPKGDRILIKDLGNTGIQNNKETLIKKIEENIKIRKQKQKTAGNSNTYSPETFIYRDIFTVKDYYRDEIPELILNARK